MDRLSELPDSVIFLIFWSLPMKDVVRTTILSKRWINLWTTTPFLNFDMSLRNTNKHRNFVNRALLRWNGVRVLKFKVDSCYGLDESIYRDTDLWVNFAKDNGVEELYLHMPLKRIFWELDDDFDHQEDCMYRVPQCLYSCSSFKVLSFKHCNFRINGNVQWNQLKSLTIIKGCGVTEHVINRMLSGSPRLEVLTVSFVERGESLCIRSTSLKELSIYKYLYTCDDLCLDSELSIWTPNLETLEIKGVPYRKCLLMDVSSLTHATLAFFGLHRFDEHDDDDDGDFSGIEIEHGVISTDDFLGDILSNSSNHPTC